MKIIYLYNPHNAHEVALIDRVKDEVLTNYVEEMAVVDYQTVKDTFRIRTTPAIVIIRDDLQGENLLSEDIETEKFRLTLELNKIMQEEEMNIYQKETKRIDRIVNSEIATRMGENYQIMQDMASLLLESEVL